MITLEISFCRGKGIDAESSLSILVEFLNAFAVVVVVIVAVVGVKCNSRI